MTGKKRYLLHIHITIAHELKAKFISILYFKNIFELHQVKHYQQRYHWDCGLSCCFMVMNSYDKDFVLTNLNKFVEEEGFGESTWTIDLCYILHRFKIKFQYTTITIGVDPGYSKEAFYDKVLAKDYDRVNSRFKAAENNQMSIVEKSVGLDKILEHLDKNGPVILLTNANLLRCSKCNNYGSCYQFCFSNTSVSYQESLISVFRIILLFLSMIGKNILKLLEFLTLGFLKSLENNYQNHYQGHYILLVGYNEKTKEILYRNPTLKDKICYINYDSLEEARTSYGTDEDILFIYSQ